MAGKFDWNATLYCNPYVASAIGAEAGIVYERLRWMVQDCKTKKNEFGTVHEDGRRWVDFTYAQLYEYLPIFKSVKALRDIMTKLEKAGLIDSKSLPRAKWYTISNLDPATLTKIVSEPCRKSSAYPDENRHDGVTKIVSDGDENRQPPIYKESESTPKQQSEATTDSSSSDLPPATSESSAVEEKEKTIIQFPSSEDELISKFADVLGVNVDGSFKLARDTRVTIIGYLRDIRRADPTLSAADFETYLEYYATQKPSRPRPTGGYVVLGWKQYKDWLETRSNEMYGDFLPGTEDYLQVSRGDWRFIKSLEAGDDFTYTDGRGTERHYIKQPDGTFTRAVEQAS